MTTTQRFPRTVSKKLNEDNKTGAFQREVLNLFSANTTAQGLVITLVQTGYCTGST